MNVIKKLKKKNSSKFQYYRINGILYREVNFNLITMRSDKVWRKEPKLTNVTIHPDGTIEEEYDKPVPNWFTYKGAILVKDTYLSAEKAKSFNQHKLNQGKYFAENKAIYSDRRR